MQKNVTCRRPPPADSIHTSISRYSHLCNCDGHIPNSLSYLLHTSGQPAVPPQNFFARAVGGRRPPMPKFWWNYEYCKFAMTCTIVPRTIVVEDPHSGIPTTSQPRTAPAPWRPRCPQARGLPCPLGSFSASADALPSCRRRIRLAIAALCRRQHRVVRCPGTPPPASNVSSTAELAPVFARQVLVNKVVFANGFNFPMTVTCCHFTFTVFFYRAMRALKLFEVRRRGRARHRARRPRRPAPSAPQS